MSPVQHLLPEDLQPACEGSPDRELLANALALLPHDQHQRILTEFVLTARRCDITRDYGPLRRLNDSLFVTARLHASEEYRLALQKALAAPVGEPVEGEEFLAMLAAKRAQQA